MMTSRTCYQSHIVRRFEVVIVIILVVLVCIAGCSPPEDPIKCLYNGSNCTITNSYGAFPDRSVCRAANVVYPVSEDELVLAVATATMNNRKMKVTTRFSHSIPKLVCLDGDNGLLISTKNLNKIHNVDTVSGIMTVDSGVTLRELIDEAAKAGLALPHTPYWWGVTVGGMLGTGAHGSSLWGKGSAVHDYVVGVRIVSPGAPENGYAMVRTLSESDPDLDAAKVSLGVLGVISQVTFQLEPLFKRSITFKTTDDFDLGEQALRLGDQHEFADMTWYPSQRKVVYRIDDRVPISNDGDGLYDFSGFRPLLSIGLAIIRFSEEIQESSGDADRKCIDALLATSVLRATAFGMTNDDFIFTGYPVTGYQNRIQSAGGCLDSPHDGLITACPWEPRVKAEFFHQTTLSISMSYVKSFIEDIQELVALSPQSLCGVELYNGILMRYVTGSTAYLGKEEDGIDFDITYYRSKDRYMPRLYEDVLEEIEQIAVFKYGGLPHWGKNRNLAFEGVLDRYKNREKFLSVKEKFDNSGLFSSVWTDQVLGLRDGLSIVKDGCALEGLCVCSEDSHCAPSRGYLCQSGRVFIEAHVCRYVD